MYNFWFLKNPIKKKIIIIAPQLINCISGVLAKEFLFAQRFFKNRRRKLEIKKWLLYCFEPVLIIAKLSFTRVLLTQEFFCCVSELLSFVKRDLEMLQGADAERKMLSLMSWPSSCHYPLPSRHNWIKLPLFVLQSVTWTWSSLAREVDKSLLPL